jgi:hypothetical protein
MGGLHWHNFAYLAADDPGIAALGRMSPSITHWTRMPPEIRCGDGRAVLCVEVRRPYAWPDALRAEFEGIDMTAFDEYLQTKPVPSDDSEDEHSKVESERPLVRALMWLSAEARGPVGYWHHAGDHGMISDVFIGAGPFAMWENESEFQDEDWDESKPRSAYTAALWHIGARVPNEDECRSVRRAFDQHRIRLAASSAESQPLADRGQEGRDVTALTERLNRLYSPGPANEGAGPTRAAAKWIARLKRIISRD